MSPALALSLVTLLAAPVFSYTTYVDDSETVALKSIKPCHIFGDQDLYGVGVRASFYISFGIALFSNFLGLEQPLKSARRGFICLLSALLIILYRSTDSGDFALLEWWLTSGLMFLSIASLPPIVFSGRRVQVDLMRKDHRDPGVATRWLKERWVRLVDDPVPLGFMLILLSIWGASQPYLYFRISSQGHKAGCLVRVRFFGPVNFYNPYFIGFMKVMSIVFAVAAAVAFFAGVGLIVWGLRYWQSLEKAAAILRAQPEQLEERRSELFLEWDALVNEMSPNSALRINYETAQANERRAIRDGQSQAVLDQLAATTRRFKRQLDERYRKQSDLRYMRERIEAQQRDLVSQRWSYRWQVTFATVLGTFLIWTVESTLLLNEIELPTSIFSSTGQALAFFVSIFSLASFIMQMLRFAGQRYTEAILYYVRLERLQRAALYGKLTRPRADTFWQRRRQEIRDLIDGLRPGSGEPIDFHDRTAGEMTSEAETLLIHPPSSTGERVGFRVISI